MPLNSQQFTIVSGPFHLSKSVNGGQVPIKILGTRRHPKFSTACHPLSESREKITQFFDHRMQMEGCTPKASNKESAAPTIWIPAPQSRSRGHIATTSATKDIERGNHQNWTIETTGQKVAKRRQKRRNGSTLTVTIARVLIFCRALGINSNLLARIWHNPKAHRFKNWCMLRPQT
ncbi:hypothetical protein MPER_12695 [Moniliophthora perniciosa FA553]|nr:hypothetical protein MPER_12695 [Moniliophthora perniciosa FA553]